MGKLRVYIASVDDKYGLFWEDGLPLYDYDSRRGGVYPIKVWRHPGWARRFAERHGYEIFEPDEYPHLRDWERERYERR